MTTKNISVLGKLYSIELTIDDYSGVAAECPAVKGANTYGENEEEALENMRTKLASIDAGDERGYIVGSVINSSLWPSVFIPTPFQGGEVRAKLAGAIARNMKIGKLVSVHEINYVAGTVVDISQEIIGKVSDLKKGQANG